MFRPNQQDHDKAMRLLTEVPEGLQLEVFSYLQVLAQVITAHVNKDFAQLESSQFDLACTMVSGYLRKLKPLCPACDLKRVVIGKPACEDCLCVNCGNAAGLEVRGRLCFGCWTFKSVWEGRSTDYPTGGL